MSVPWLTGDEVVRLVSPSTRFITRVRAVVRTVMAVLVLFAAAPGVAPAQADSVTFAVIGDYGLADTPAAAVASLVTSWNPDFIITTGDNNYYTGAAATIDTNIGQYYHAFIHPYRGQYGPGASVNRFFPSLGNHDWETPGARPYLDYFSLPGNERYYDVVQGPVHLFALDSDPDEPDGVSMNSVQAAWLQGRLAASTAPWKIVYFHHAPYSSGPHGSAAFMQWPFAEWGAHAVLAGHDHLYERVTHDDFPYFVNGLGGASRYDFAVPIAGSQVRYNGDFGAMLVEASPESLAFQFITRAGIVVDRYTLYAVPGAHPPAAPSHLTATPVSGRELRLVWRDNASNESGFRLEQLGDGDVVLSAVAVEANVTESVVGGLAPLTTYRYRVVAFNGAGGAASDPATVRTQASGPPVAPGPLTARAVSSSQIDLAWTDGSLNESGFTVEQAVNDSAFAAIASVPDNATTLSVNGLAPPSLYRFRVRAHNPDGVSPYSNTVSLPTAFVDLAMAVVSEPPATAAAGQRFSASSTIRNTGSLSARSSKSRFYFSVDAARGPGDLLLLGTTGVPALAPGATRTAAVTITIPAGTPPGTYYFLACADDIGALAESDEGNNCRASTRGLVLGRPDLVATAVGDPPATLRRGARFTASDTVANHGSAPAAATKVRYHLSADAVPGSGDRLLVGIRSVPVLAVGASAPGTRLVTVPSSTPAGDYWFFACADDTDTVTEDDEANNCRAASRRLQVTP
jgi:hypothetical protein